MGTTSTKNDISGCGLTCPDGLDGHNYILECYQSCTNTTNCVAFTWTSGNLCHMYNSSIPNGDAGILYIIS